MKTYIVLILSSFLITAASAAAEQRSNILFILADDLGVRDTGFMGSTYYETPHLDQLAAGGMTFTRAYAANPLCSPTRAALMTGKAPARLWLTRAIVKKFYGQTPGPGQSASAEDAFIEPLIRDRLPLEEVTLAERFKAAGYTTGIIGKWHLGPTELTPESQGFDINVAAGEHNGPPSYFSPYHLPKLPDGPKGEYLPERLATEVEKFLSAKRDKPFFLYMSHYSVHGGFQAKPEIVQKYRDKKARTGKAQGNPIYAAMVEALDDSVGRILASLDRLGLAENTIVVFTSDNGGLLLTPPGTPKSYGIVGQVTSNAPYRGGKSSAYEGGLRVPCVLRWPGVTQSGSTSDVPMVTHDWFPTLLEACGINLPGETAATLDGMSLVPLLKSGQPPKRDPLFFHWPHGAHPECAMVSGDWKYHHRFDGQHELYNLAKDKGESRNLVGTEPERVKQFGERVNAWLKSVNAQIPQPNPEYQPAPTDKAKPGAKKAAKP